MSYQVLARKWRPRNFSQVVGQQTILRALINALEQNRLHHAYLFTGTRGVGKTTLGRILAKSLNCEQGLSAEPCGVCSTCREIDEGRFVDLLEVDAASRTKVEDTRELLENVQYAPSRGRFKVYLIDEVHMLSSHSFNALLKTLEEPPPHVKFILATTDPQKVPVTILSRCMKFHLHSINADLIQGYLRYVLEQEAVGAEDEALKVIARAAAGSMRDALSLMDQAIAFSGGMVEAAHIRDMLGLQEQQQLAALLQALAQKDGAALLAQVEHMAQLGADFNHVLDELGSYLHELALLQILADEQAEADKQSLAQVLSAEDVQLYYQIALMGKKELAYAPDFRTGFEMILLRMLAFYLEPVDAVGTRSSDNAPASKAVKGAPASNLVSTPADNAAISSREAAMAAIRSATGADARAKKMQQEQPVRRSAVPEPLAQASAPMQHSEITLSAQPNKQSATQPATVPTEQPGDSFADEWSSLVDKLAIGGMTRQLALNCIVQQQDNDRWVLQVGSAQAGLVNQKQVQSLQSAVSQALGREIRLQFETVAAPSGQETPAQRQARLQQQKLQAAMDTLAADENIRAMQENFGVELKADAINLNEK